MRGAGQKKMGKEKRDGAGDVNGLKALRQREIFGMRNEKMKKES